jgi:very-short-patch-repair endonuclease
VGDADGKHRGKHHLLHQRAVPQEGVLSREQLHDLGLNDEQIARRERNGALHELYTDVWAVGRHSVTPKGHLIAALLSCGTTSFHSHRTSAALNGLRAINLRAIEVTMVGTCSRARTGLITHRTAKPPHSMDIRTVGPLRYSSVPRMLIELAPRETAEELSRLITEAVRRRLLNVHAMEAALARHPRWPGLARLKTALHAYRPRPDRKSELERAFDEWLLQHPEIPQPQRNVHIDQWEIDCFWPDQKVALELDGRTYHVAAGDMERDRLKDTKLQIMAIKPMRVTGERWDLDRPGVYDDLMKLLELG